MLGRLLLIGLGIVAYLKRDQIADIVNRQVGREPGTEPNDKASPKPRSAPRRPAS